MSAEKSTVTNTESNIAKHVGPPSFLGRTLPSLLYRACAVYPNEKAFVQKEDSGWQPWSSSRFKQAAEELAAGLLSCGLKPGDRVAIYMDSDVYFCLADMACLMAGLVDVPIYLTHTRETIEHVIKHADAHAMIVTDETDVAELTAVLEDLDTVHTIVMCHPKNDGTDAKVDGASCTTLDTIRETGRRQITETPEFVRRMTDAQDPNDLATIIYTSGTTGLPKGVMLTHENVSSNALMAFTALTTYRPGPDGETMLSFLPLTHIFARTLYYGALANGSSLVFSHPDRLVEDLADVRPTILPTVPRVLEKLYARILRRSADMSGLQGRIARWGVRKAQSEDSWGLGTRLADRLVFRKWREILGGRIQYIISGGAALNPEIATVFDHAGICILQGYGLTETSPVIAFNRPEDNRPGTVGQPLDGVEVRIAEDGEIMTRGPHVMAGYFRDEERTREAMEADGWFHTGDIGELSEDGFLTITDRKKDLFKLSTGKYVMPQPIEGRLTAEPLVDHTVVTGAGHKFSSALVFPNEDTLREKAASLGLDRSLPLGQLTEHPEILKVFDQLIERANEGQPHWATVKRYTVVPEEMTVENGMLTPTLKVRRPVVHKKYKARIEAMYEDEQNISEDELADGSGI